MKVSDTQTPSAQGDGPHAHMAVFDTEGRHVLVPDLGLDKVFAYKVEQDSGELKLCSELVLPPGSGPRHVVMHPDGTQLYILSELLSTVSTCTWDSQTGQFGSISGELPLVPGAAVGIEGKTFGAAIRVSPRGDFVYASNRGHDSIAVFAVGEDKQLTFRGATLTSASKQGEVGPAVWPPVDCPRDFTLSGVNGEWVVVGNQDTDNVVVFARDLETGLLSSINVSAEVAAPVCILAMKSML